MNKAPPMTRAYASYALGLLTLINVVNYMARNVLFALFEPIKRDLNLTDAHLGWLGAALMSREAAEDGLRRALELQLDGLRARAEQRSES